MSEDKIPSKEELNEITQDDIDKAYNDFGVFDKVEPSIIPTPTRTFELEETVRLGGLEDIQVKEILHDGKAYRLEYTSTGKHERTREKYYTRLTRIWWWFDVKKLDSADPDADNLFAPRLPGNVSTTAIDSLIHMMSHNGLVCDPRYQRGYVWSLDDQESLIDSMFNHVNIGSLVFSRHAGYHHKNSDETVKYMNFDGDEVEISRSRDYTSAVIDGQQRATTIWRFMTNQFTYCGRYWKDLSPYDQIDFKGINISTRTFDEEDVPYEAVLRMFLKVNKGVPQDEKHLEAISAQLAELTK